jgi:monoterpene epsilon-lactone hydrolase
MLDRDSVEMYAKYYAGEYDRTSPLIAPLFADLSGLPPLLIQVGNDVILLDDAT